MKIIRFKRIRILRKHFKNQGGKVTKSCFFKFRKGYDPSVKFFRALTFRKSLKSFSFCLTSLPTVVSTSIPCFWKFLSKQVKRNSSFRVSTKPEVLASIRRATSGSLERRRSLYFFRTNSHLVCNLFWHISTSFPTLERFFLIPSSTFLIAISRFSKAGFNSSISRWNCRLFIRFK